jgi:hypothetical protein
MIGIISSAMQLVEPDLPEELPDILEDFLQEDRE